MKRSHLVCPGFCIDDALCPSDLQTLSDGFRPSPGDRDWTMEGGSVVLLRAQHEPPASIFMLGGDPPEAAWPPSGFNPIYPMLLLTKRQSLPSLPP